jgi:hypothetical protein
MHGARTWDPGFFFSAAGAPFVISAVNWFDYTHNSIHIITPFDSGGSSAKAATSLPYARHRRCEKPLMALADRTIHGFPDIYSLFAYRFPKEGDPNDAGRELGAMIDGRHELVKGDSGPHEKNHPASPSHVSLNGSRRNLI